MQKICLYNFTKKKQRGQRRKLKRLTFAINAFIPFENFKKHSERFLDTGYDHFHVPCDISFINSNKTYGKVKSEFCKKWIDATEKNILKKPENLEFCKIVCVIQEKDLWSSQIIVFYSEDYYNLFWERNSPWQIWLQVSDKTLSFVKPRNIDTVLNEQGYIEIMQDIEDNGALIKHQDILWFYGDVPAQ